MCIKGEAWWTQLIDLGLAGREVHRKGSDRWSSIELWKMELDYAEKLLENTMIAVPGRRDWVIALRDISL